MASRFMLAARPFTAKVRRLPQVGYPARSGQRFRTLNCPCVLAFTGRVPAPGFWRGPGAVFAIHIVFEIRPGIFRVRILDWTNQVVAKFQLNYLTGKILEQENICNDNCKTFNNKASNCWPIKISWHLKICILWNLC